MRKKNNSNPPTLGLRNNAHEVQVMVPNGSTQAVLGTRHPAPADTRAGHIRQFGGPRPAPRQTPQAAIELPLSTRTQTALLNRLPRATRDVLNGGSGDQSASRRTDQSGTEELLAPD